MAPGTFAPFKIRLMRLARNTRCSLLQKDLNTLRRSCFPGLDTSAKWCVLYRSAVWTAVLDRVHAGVPLLGICVGLQCLFEESEEAPGVKGLGLFPGAIKRFPTEMRVPHMGWNTLDRVKDCRLLDGLADEPYVCFLHSYYAPLCAATAASCTYEFTYTAMLHQDNIYAVQFHPEKSGPAGLRVMRNFIELC